MAIPRSRLRDVCHDLLAAVQSGLTSEGVPIPDRAYVSAGAPSLDLDVCSLLAVWAESIPRDQGGLGSSPDPFMEDDARWVMRTGIFVVTLARCCATLTDDGKAPPVAAEEAASDLLYGDAISIPNAVIAAFNAGQLSTSCHGLAYQGWQVIGPAGGTVATEVRFEISLTAGGV